MAEVAGVVLGIFPLLVTAVEHYDEILRPLETYRHFPSKLKLVQRQLKTQKAIFQNQSYLLVSRLTSKDDANRFFDRRSSWQNNPHIDIELATRLSRSAEACKDLIRAIEDHLCDLEAETKLLETWIADTGDGDASANGGKLWFRQVRKKIKFSFSGPRFDRCIAGLRQLNQDFIYLSNPILHIDASGHHTVPWVRPTAQNAGWNIEEYQFTRKASQHLYEALRKACTSHTEHSANLCLDAIPVCCDDANSIHVEFSIAYTPRLLADGVPMVKPMWLVIESVINETVLGDASEATAISGNPMEEALHVLSDTLERQELEGTASRLLPGTKRVRFAAACSEQQKTKRHSPNVSVSKPTHFTPKLEILKNFCEERNFCTQLQHWQLRPHPNECIRECLGLLDRTNTHHHLVYRTPNKTSSPKKGLISLAQLISSISEGKPTRGLPLIERLRLAKKLASAVLKLHATPWLAKTWRSENVFFFDQEQDATKQYEHALTAPHLSVPVGLNQLTTAESNDNPNQQLLAYNPILFGLGVILLELGFETPMRSLQQPEDLAGGMETRLTEYFTASRLSKMLGSTLGSTYAGIVRKLLVCDFGHGDDFNDPKLQAAFYSDVVCQLEKLEEGLRKLEQGLSGG
ncbi:MAG: hypothetical protein M1816_001343 [Peltula sp. TS41687]|nr:MAG: hypothetical protein M1816_001343 [Peltula sp. TS41687]